VRPRLPFERQLALFAFLAALPPLVLLVFFSRSWKAVAMAALLSLAVIYYIRRMVVHRLRTVSGMIGALREADYSMRLRGATTGDALAEVLSEVNALAELLRDQRLGGVESAALVRAIIGELDSAIFAFDDQQRLQLINRAGERLLASDAAHLIGHRFDEIGLTNAFEGTSVQTVDLNFPGATGRWRIHRSHFREKGRPHSLLVLSDLSRPLREEELLAWQRLLRVLGHELNNSLAPIHSIAASLASVFSREALPDDWKDDAKRGLAVISSRAESLTRFTEAYVRLAKLPRPNARPFDVESLLRHVIELERRIDVRLDAGPPARVNADRDLLEQLLINVVRNAVDAALETGGAVAATWRRGVDELEIAVIDEGPGLSGTQNLFVPFYTTKPGGTGIGLILCRQIADAHGGSFHLRQRGDRTGCEAVLRLPA